ncbi:MAG TPA: alkaline phosphatase family protein [Candidatus Sulfomarinibacteraceae bacterium]|nr:alkaline phosphatase family protein [Candidatus Sulfomarinibacteraceae bacterium]
MEKSFKLPDYQGRSIANIPATVAGLFEAPFVGLPALADELWEPLLASGNVRHIVLLLIDGMGLNLIRAAGDDAGWLPAEATVRGELTSVFPSTTVAALSSLWTGVAPAQHGLLGLKMFFSQFATMGHMLQFSPSFAPFPDALVEAGLDPETFLPAPGLAQQLARAGVRTYSLKHYGLVESALSKMHNRGVARGIGTVTAADTMWWIRHTLETDPHERNCLIAYWAAVDSLQHVHGPGHPAVMAELYSVLHLVRRELLHALSAEARRGAVLLVTADHGQIQTPVEQRIFLEDHPQLQELLLMQPAGEPRTVYLYARQGCSDDVVAYLREYLPQAAVAAPAQQALDEGWFGPHPYAEQTALRVGDVVVTMREGYALTTRDEARFVQQMGGRHGGLSPQEMSVPWYAFRLDA